MTLYRIEVDGCDDCTHVDVELTDAEAAVVARVAFAVTDASEYGCQPTMSVTNEAPDGDA